MKINRSPIYYTGNKTRLLPQLIPLFPKDISTFYDLFGGSGVVSINMADMVDKVVYNEYSTGLFNIFNGLKYGDIDSICEKVRAFATLVVDKQSYMIERNKLDISIDFNRWMLSHFTFSNILPQVRQFGSTSAYGHRTFKENIIRPALANLQSKPNMQLSNKSYLQFNDFEKNAFVYLDPPYFSTANKYATEWNWDNETELLNWIENILIANNVNFGMSNATSEHLLEFAKKHNLQVHYPNIKYKPSGTAKTETKEIYITNYKGAE